MEDVPESEAVSFNPGFNFYSPCRCVDIAAEVTDEQEPSETSTDSDDYIEFTFICREGQIHQTFSIFNRDPLERTDQDQSDKKPTEFSPRLELEKSVADDRGEGRDPPSFSSEVDELESVPVEEDCIWKPTLIDSSSRCKKCNSMSSSSEVDELEGVPVEEYCIWKPRLVESSSRYKKCNSTGSASKKWKLSDLLLHRRSNSKGKDSFLFLALKNRELKAEKQGRVETQSDKKPTELSLRLQLEKPSADDSGKGRDPPPLSSEVDESESVLVEEYCIWRPKVVDSSRRFKKCNSTGSALKQWQLRDLFLLRRINSEGKEDLFLAPKNRELKDEKPGRVETQSNKKPTELSLRLQLEKLSAADDSSQGRDPPPSSEVDELESLPVEKYCVWRPKVVDSSRRFKKCNSTGSVSKQWKLLDLLLLCRSNREGKDSSFVFPTLKNREPNADKQGRVETQSNKKPSELSLRLQLEKPSAADDSGQERDPPLSSEVDELKSVPLEYCVWRPKVVDSSRRFKKCNSTGSVSKQWKLLDLLLLRRSNSEGREDSFVFLTPKNREVKVSAHEQERVETKKARKAKVSAHEVFYLQNRAWKEEEKRKTYLPYRQDLVGFFAKANVVGTTYPQRQTYMGSHGGTSST